MISNRLIVNLGTVCIITASIRREEAKKKSKQKSAVNPFDLDESMESDDKNPFTESITEQEEEDSYNPFDDDSLSSPMTTVSSQSTETSKSLSGGFSSLERRKNARNLSGDGDAVVLSQRQMAERPMYTGTPPQTPPGDRPQQQALAISPPKGGFLGMDSHQARYVHIVIIQNRDSE